MLCLSQTATMLRCHDATLDECIDNNDTGNEAASARNKGMCTHWVDHRYYAKQKENSSLKMYHFCYFSLCFLFNPLACVWRKGKTEKAATWIKEIDVGIKSFYKIHSCGYLHVRI